MKEDILETKKVFVCGGGHQGLSMAAHLSLNGIKVTLWNRSAAHIQEIINTGKIHCTGIIKGTACIEKASSELSEVVSDFIMIVTPSSAHKDMAKALAPYIHKDMIIVLNPGRTFGAIEFAQTLIESGVAELPHIAETQTIIYTCRRSESNSTVIYALKNGVDIASVYPEDIKFILKKMPECIRKYFNPVDSTNITSLSNVGMVLHCAPVLMNIGWIETEKVDFKYYYDGISPSVAHFIEKIDDERRNVAAALGVNIESVAEWLKRTYHTYGDNLYECLRNNISYREIDAPHTIYHRYLYEDVPCGLVPVEDAGKQLGVPTPNITTIINLASAVLEKDFRVIGRKYYSAENLNVNREQKSILDDL